MKAIKFVSLVITLMAALPLSAKITQLYDRQGNPYCEIDANGVFEFIEGKCPGSPLLLNYTQIGEYQCETDIGESIQINLEILRVTRIKVEAFGKVFHGLNSGGGIGLPEDFSVRSKMADIYEPETLVFSNKDSEPFAGGPNHLVVHHKNGRAPWVFNLVCE